MTLRLQIKVHRLSNPDGKSNFRSEISFSKGQHGVCEINSLKGELSTASSPEAGEIDFKTAASAVRNHEIPDDLDDLTLEELAQLPDGHNNPAITALQSLVRGLLISETVTLRQQFSVSLPTLGVTTLIPDCSPASEDQEGCHAVALEIIVLRELSLLGLGPLLKELGDIFIHQPESDSELPILFYWLAFQVNHNPETHDIPSRLLVKRLFSRGLAIDPSGRLVDPEELCTMIYMTRTAVERWGREHGDILGFLTERLVLLIGKFGCTLTLENGVRWCQEAFALYPTTDHAEVEIFGRLLFTRFQRLKREEDLEEALVWGRRALDVCPADNEQARVHDLYALGERLFAKHRTFGNVGDSDLDEAIQMWRAAYELESNGQGGSGCPAFVSLHQLATATHARYIERRQQADINECIKLGRRLLEFFPPGHKHRDEAISMLCEFLVEHIHDPKYMEEIVDLLHQKQYPRDHADVEPHCRSLCKSAGIMMYCGYLSSKVEYVDEAIRLFQQAFSITVTNEGKCGASTGLGYAHLVRLWAKRSASDATAALEHLTKAYNEWDSHTALMGLVEFYADEENQHYDPQRAIGLLETCLEREDMGAGQRLEFVTHIITSYPDIAIDTKFSKQLQVILLKTIRLMPRAAYFGLHVKSRLRTLRQWPSWVNLLATLLCSNHKPVQAIEMLEEARAVFWSQGQQLRMDFEQDPSPPPSYPEKYHNVHHRVPQLPQEFRQRLYRIAQELESASFAPELGMTGIMPMIEDEELVRRRRLNAEYNDVIEQVRKLPGFECFMLPEPICLLAEAAAKGPVVILVSFGEAYAIIIEYPDTHIPKVTPLKLRYATLKSLHRVRGVLDQATRGEHDRDDEYGTDSGETRLDGGPLNTASGAGRVLEFLWKCVVKPVIDALGFKPTCGRHRPRLWWCPTGEFTFLPIHAAGIYRIGVQDCCSDYMVSSYTPTLSALKQVQSTLQPPARGNIKMLLAAVPRPYEGSYLKGAVKELKEVSSTMSPGIRISLPVEEDSLLDGEAGVSAATVLKHLLTADILHLACHGKQDNSSPLDSGFIMRDRKLTISELMTLNLPRAFLAFLSACETAKGDEKQSDEVIHLAASMLFTGFKSVVGTMWFMTDQDGPYVSRRVYEHIFSGNAEFLDANAVPYALDVAVQELREKGLPPERWAVFVHYGA